MEDEVEEKRGKLTMTLIGNKQAKQKIDEVEEQELLPGILDAITICKIAPKLPWTTFPILASVSHSWRRAIRSSQIYSARVLSTSTQTLVALIRTLDKDVTAVSINDGPNDVERRITLFSTEDGSCDHLPPIPGVKEGIPLSCGCVCWDGKLYILGGTRDGRFTLARKGKAGGGGVPARADVYVLDVAGERQWKKCAMMRNCREDFGCAVKDRKFFVFGGGSDGRPVYGAEVYDPKADSWSPITPVPSLRYSHKVSTLGEELVLHGGSFFKSEFFEGDPNRIIDFDDVQSSHREYAVPAEVYHPLKNEWRNMEHFTENRGFLDIVAMVRGKFFKLNRGGLQVYNIQANSWEPSIPPWQEFSPSYCVWKSSQCFQLMPRVLFAVALDIELLALVYGAKLELDSDEAANLPFLMKSQGVAGDIDKIMWHIVPCPFLSTTMCPIKL